MSGSVTAKQRTRQGCLTCRKRRRKCDEARPKCQNCAERHLDCRYGMRIIFRESNCMGLAPMERRELEERGSTKYSDLRFIDAMEEDLEEFTKSSSEDATTAHTPQEDPEPMTQSPLRIVENNFEENLLHNEDDPGMNETKSHGLGDIERVDSIQTPIITTTSSRDIFDADLERPMDTSQAMCFPRSQDPMSLEYLASPISSSLSLHGFSFHRPFSSERSGGYDLDKPTPDNGNTQPSITTSELHALLKVFLEKVTPWLDLNCQANSLGIQLSLMAGTCLALRYSMLVIAACQEDMQNVPSTYHMVKKVLRELALRHLESEVYQNESGFAARNLLGVSQILTAELQEWNVVLRALSEGYSAASQQNNILNQQPISWVIARYDIAAAIISSQPTMGNFEQYNDVAQFLPAIEIQDAIILCAQTVNLNLAQATHPLSRKAAWLKLHSATENWQKHLVTAAQPILAIDSVKAADSEDISTSFPVVIYTNRAIFYTAFLYHLSCLLLLQSRPHTLRRMKSTCLRTVPWHAVHLCGVSKSNRLAWSHDPIVVATLLYAGKSLSYFGQQNEILLHLETLTTLTGWKIRKETQRLTGLWKAGE